AGSLLLPSLREGLSRTHSVFLIALHSSNSVRCSRRPTRAHAGSPAGARCSARHWQQTDPALLSSSSPPDRIGSLAAAGRRSAQERTPCQRRTPPAGQEESVTASASTSTSCPNDASASPTHAWPTRGVGASTTPVPLIQRVEGRKHRAGDLVVAAQE